jgi:hypothetical protein
LIFTIFEKNILPAVIDLIDTLATWDGKTLLRLESQLGRFLDWLPRKPACFGFVYQIALEPQKKPSVKVEG